MALTDAKLTRHLRARLDACGQKDVLIYYPLALPGTLFRNETALKAILGALHDVPIDALWLRVHPFGTAASGPRALRGYIRACRTLHASGLPIVAERTGTVGLPLMAFGAVGGIESGITFGERFDVKPLLRPVRTGTPFSPSPRVYIAKLGVFLSRDAAQALFDRRGMRTSFACPDPRCCRLGYKSMIADPKRHFVLERSREVAQLSQIPAHLREMHYLEEVLRPATDHALRAARAEASLERTLRRLESWRQTLGALHVEQPARTHSEVPRRLRLGRKYAV